MTDLDYIQTPGKFYQDLKTCCLISRIYTTASLIHSGNDYKIERGSFPFSMFSQLRGPVMDRLSRLDIEFYESAVISSFNGMIGTKVQVIFSDSLTHHRIDDTLFSGIASFNGVDNAGTPTIGFGFLGRNLTPDGSRLITDGLSSLNNGRILLDYTVHLISSDGMLAFRIAHELMHHLGFEEDCADKKALETLGCFYPDFILLAKMVRSEMRASYESFAARIHTALSRGRSILPSLERMADLLPERHLFPVPSDDYLVTTSYSFDHFIDSGKPEVSGITTLFL